jgi:DUF1680 family protein
VIRGAVLPAQRGAADRKPRRLLGTADADGVQLHQYATGTVRAGEMTLSVRTDYPWDGRIEIGVEETSDEPWTLTLRVPAWAQGATLDGEPVAPGAAPLTRTWAPGDSVVLELPMDVRWVAPDPRIDAVRGCVAVERGPLVYCAESPAGEADLEAVAVEPGVAEECAGDGLDGVVGLRVAAREVVVQRGAEWPYGEAPAGRGARRTLTLIPYHAWANRGPSTMRVWIPV